MMSFDTDPSQTQLSRKKQILVSLLSFNDPDSLYRSVESFTKQTFPEFDLLVVDNGSNNIQWDLFRTCYPNILIINLSSNHGFGGGNNMALRYGLEQGYEYVLICNDDIVVEPDCLRHLMKAVEEEHVTVGVWGGIEIDARNSKVLSCGGYLVPGLNRIFWKSFHQQKCSAQLFDSFAPQGAFMLFPRRTLERGILLNEDLFLYCEELDLGYQIKREGLRAKICTEVRYFHDVGGNRQAPGLNPRKAYFIERNRILIAKKYFDTSFYYFFLWIHAVELLLKILYRLPNSPKGFVLALLWGAYDGITGNVLSPDRIKNSSLATSG